MSNVYIVTVRLPKRDSHDPRNKVTGPCPLNGVECTDVTGEHHSTLVTATSVEHIREKMTAAHITRIEKL